MNPMVEEFIDEICSHVKFKRAHKEIKKEFLNHIEEKAEDLMAEGVSAEEAPQVALSQMGEAEVIGKQLNESHKAAPEWSILILTFLFSVFGLVVLYFMAIDEISRNAQYFRKNAIFNILGYLAMAGLYFFDYKRLEKYSKKVFIGVTLVLFIQLLTAISVNGQKAWLQLGPLSINITDLSLFLYVISLAKLFKDLDLRNIKGYANLSAMLFVPFILFIQLGTSMPAIAYFVVFMVFMFMKKIRLSYIFSVIGLLLVSGFYFVISEPYRVHRLMVFINAQSDSQGTGYVNFQIDKLLKSVGFMGNGFTFPKRLIPEVESSFILTYIIYTFGWIAGFVLITLIFAFIIRIFMTARAVKDIYGRFIIQGFMCIFALKFIWNILMILGFAPIVSVALPFISYGGSGVFMQTAAIGLITSIYRNKSLSYVCH